MKKIIIALMSVIICVTLAVGLTACEDDTHNANGSPKNMAEAIIDFDDSTTHSNRLHRWFDEGTYAGSLSNTENVSRALGDGTGYDKYSGFSFIWGKGGRYKITKLEFDITSQTPSPITVDCQFTEPAKNGGKGEYKHLNEITIENGQTVHIVFDNLNCRYSKFAQSVNFKNDGRTKDMSVLNWQIKISNLFITAEKA